MSRILGDLRQSLRLLRRKRAFTFVVVLTLGLGIGVTTAVFSVFHGVLMQPLPFPDPDRLVRVYDVQPSCATCPASFPKYHDWRERNRVFEAIGGSAPTSLALTGRGLPAQFTGMRTTASLVDVFGVPPRIGRWFSEEEDQPGGPSVVVVTHEFWSSQLSGSPDVLGSTLVLDGTGHEVIGVMPAGFTHRGADLFVPLQRELDPSTRGSHFLAIYARLADGVTVERAQAEMKQLGEELIAEFGGNHGIDVQSYHEAIVGNVRAPLRVLLAATLMLLLIAATNVANLLLAAGIERRHDLAIRLVMGGKRSDIARQLLVEGFVLAAAAGLAGVTLAFVFVRGLRVAVADVLPRAASISVDLNVLAFSAGVSVVVGLFCSVWPILVVQRESLSVIVREDGTRASRSSGRKLRNGLVVAEIALSFVLIVGAGLMAKDLVLLEERQTGFRTERIVAFDLAPSGSRYETPEATSRLWEELHERLTRVDAIESVGLTSHLPMANFGYNGEFRIEGEQPWPDSEAPLVEYRWMHGEYLETLGVPLLKGRKLGPGDGEGTRTVLVNRTMAAMFWPGQDPIGKRFGQGDDLSAWYEVVGVIGDVRSRGRADAPAPEFYRLIAQSPFTRMTVVMRSKSEDALAMVPTAREIVASIDPTLAVANVATMDEVVTKSVGRPRLFAMLSGSFALVAGLLAIVGIYGVIDYSVRRERREFGIRLAIGASPSDVRSQVLRNGLRLALTGIGIGAAGSWALARFLRALLHDAQPVDPAVLCLTASVLIMAALGSALLPAHSATKVDPSVVLREA